MTIRTLFNPDRVEVDGMVVPVVEDSYLDENGESQKISYIVINGEKKAVKYRIEIEEKIILHKIDVAIQKVEEDRLKKIEDKKIEEEKNNPKPDPIKP